MEQLSTPDCFLGAFRSVLDGWFYGLEEDVLAEGTIDPEDQQKLADRADELLEQRLGEITRATPQFAAALRAYRSAQRNGEHATAEGLAGWLAGQPHIGAGVKREAGIKGDVDHFAALSFLRGLLLILRDSGYAGLVLVLDEVETIQRVRSDVRDKSLNALRQLMDEVDGGRFPGLYLVVTGTPAFFEGPQGVQRLEPLAQRLYVDFQTEERFDNPRAVQIRLPGFSIERLTLVGRRVREIYESHASDAGRIRERCSDDCIRQLADAVTGRLGGKVGVAPRIFLKKLVGDVLDRIDQFADFDPAMNYHLTIAETELNRVERQAMGATDVDEIELES
jgi:hypothetical protein